MRYYIHTFMHMYVHIHVLRKHSINRAMSVPHNRIFFSHGHQRVNFVYYVSELKKNVEQKKQWDKDHTAHDFMFVKYQSEQIYRDSKHPPG